MSILKKLSNRNDKLSPAMAATLAALNISDELFKTKNELKDLQKKIQRTSRKI
jgi:Cell division protein ZapA.